MAQRKRTARPRPKTPARVKKRRQRRARQRSHHLPELVGLVLVASGVFLACVLWFGWSGGPVPKAVTDTVGWAAYFAPLVLVPLGALIVTRSELVAVRPFRLGLAVAALGLLLTLGSDHGGFLGEKLSSLFALGLGSVGTTILGVLLVVVGVLFLTGASLGALVRRSGRAVRHASTRVRRESRRDPGRSASVAPPPPSVHEPVREPPVDVAQDYPDLVGETQPPPLVALFADEEPTHEDTQQSLFDVTAEAPPEYHLPDRSLLRKSKPGTGPNAEANRRIEEALVQCLANFGVEATVVGEISGPRVTRYELQLAPGTKVGKVAQLKDDLSYALATTEIRILAPIPGKQAVGVEVPNLSPNMVLLGDIFDDLPAASSPLAVWLGKDISGAAVWTDLARMPHILIAGTTGSGKSGCINTMLTSILLRATPDDVRMILIDPKRIELGYYESIPHLLTPVVSSPKEASAVLLNIVTEMERRYERLSQVRARNLPEANRALRKRGEPELPYLLVVIDELADLMMVSPQDVEDAIIRLAQKSRAVGIHLVLATQRPSVDVITGMIKANVPSRIAFAVSSQTDSRVILDQNGAESLLGQGDMLFKPLGTSRLQRVQGAFVTEEEIALVVEAARSQREQEVDESFLEAPQVFADDVDDGDFDPDEDPLLDRAIEVVVTAQTASVSLLQRRLRVGYTRAGRLIDMLERRGIISPYEGSKPRRVLVSEHELGTHLIDAS
ncbi:MAG TPA: DNA translocase FtsK [Gaiellaceae bacterium]|jgi:S-DNA-T family DNA segregation ATPase FtsK/SpoIIIE